MNKTGKTIVGIILAVILLIIGISLISKWTNKPTKIDEGQFLQKIESDEIEKIYIDGYVVKGYTKKADGTISKNAKYQTTIVDRSYFREKIEVYVDATTGNTLKLNSSDPNETDVWSIIIPVAGLVMFIIIGYFIIRQTRGGDSKALNFAKVKTRNQENSKVRFNDVAGAEEEKQELAEIVEFLKNPKNFSTMGARVPKGVLLVGPPGTGKTLFAKAVAGEAGVPFFSISGSDFVEMFVGVGASRVRDMFEIAKKSMPCIVFIDEIDAVGRQRGTGLGGGNDEREQTLNQLLVQMDGFETNSGIIIMAATNRADILDPALLRPGRFDRQIYIHMPDVKGREAILKVHARNKPLASDVSFQKLARLTSGFSGADLENLLNEAAILATRAGHTLITNVDLYEAFNKVIAGPQKKSRLVTEADKRITAYHEAGHAILAKVLEHCDAVHEVSIIPRGMAAGYTLTRPDSDDDHMTKAKLLDMIVMMLGGRIAEEIVIKDISTGASNDLERISKIARSMVSEWGMSDALGNLSFGESREVFIGREMGTRPPYSEATANLIDQEIKNIIENAHKRGLEVLKKYRTALDTMARLLIEKETIYGEEVDMIVDKGASVQEVIEYMEKQETAEKNFKNPLERIIVKEKLQEKEETSQEEVTEEENKEE